MTYNPFPDRKGAFQLWVSLKGIMRGFCDFVILISEAQEKPRGRTSAMSSSAVSCESAVLVNQAHTGPLAQGSSVLVYLVSAWTAAAFAGMGYVDYV